MVLDIISRTSFPSVCKVTFDKKRVMKINYYPLTSHVMHINPIISWAKFLMLFVNDSIRIDSHLITVLERIAVWYRYPFVCPC